MQKYYKRVKVAGHPYAEKSGHVLVHRLVMEEYLGRYLTPGEVVHHIDGDTTNNKIENLQLFSEREHHLNHCPGPRNKYTDEEIKEALNGRSPEQASIYLGRYRNFIYTWYRHLIVFQRPRKSKEVTRYVRRNAAPRSDRKRPIDQTE